MNLSNLLREHRIDPRDVLVLRHSPREPELRKVLPWLVTEKPAVFNAYQQTQGPKLERAMQAMIGSGFVASFIGHEPGKAVFVGMYSLISSKPLTFDEYWQIPAYVELKEFGSKGWCRETDTRTTLLWFDLERTDFCASWQGKLIVAWPSERSWWRRAHRKEIPIAAILEDSGLSAEMPEWHDVEFTWADLGLEGSWKQRLHTRQPYGLNEN